MIKGIIVATAAALIATTAIADTHAHDHLVSTDDVAWQDVIPGVQLALAWGTPEAGDDIWLIRMDPGAGVPSHLHTNDYWGITIQGDWVHVHEDGYEAVAKPGAYAFVKGGALHADRCDGDIPCIGLLDFNGERDAIFPD